MDEREIDYSDGHLERTKPYEYNCKIHGSGYAELDECPECMKEDYLGNPPDPTPICDRCGEPVDYIEDPDPHQSGFQWFQIREAWGDTDCVEYEGSCEGICKTCYDAFQKWLKSYEPLT